MLPRIRVARPCATCGLGCEKRSSVPRRKPDGIITSPQACPTASHAPACVKSEICYGARRRPLRCACGKSRSPDPADRETDRTPAQSAGDAGRWHFVQPDGRHGRDLFARLRVGIGHGAGRLGADRHDSAVGRRRPAIGLADRRAAARFASPLGRGLRLCQAACFVTLVRRRLARLHSDGGAVRRGGRLLGFGARHQSGLEHLGRHDCADAAAPATLPAARDSVRSARSSVS